MQRTRGAANMVRFSWLLPRKRMRSGDRPGLQNRRAAGFLSPVGSTPTRFRHVSTTRRSSTAWGAKIIGAAAFAGESGGSCDEGGPIFSILCFAHDIE